MVLRQLTKEQAKEEVKKLVDKYNRIVESGSIKGYSENGTKKDFITPLFKALGWDVENEYSDDEVRNEEKVSKGRVDYSFRINGIPKFFLEAKALKEDLDNIKFVEQAINYAWHKGCTWAILTDFEVIKIFNAEWKSPNPLQAQFGQTLPCQLFLEKFDTLWLLSRESFENKLLDIEAEKWGKKVKKISVDKQLLDDLTKWRDLLNKNILKNNASKNISGDELDEAVQRIIDRLIFIRTLEDKELEAPMLQSVVREDLNKRIYKKLNLVFRKIDDMYNSKLFTPHLCEDLDIDDEILAKIINGLFHSSDNTVHYDFSAIDTDVLGNIYEQYLGHILKKTDKRAKLAEGKAHRKEQGIYYTPTYVVDYIVKNTVGELAKDKKCDVKNIKILDPACGSGSFLMKAFDYLITLDKKKNGEANQTKLDLTGASATYGRKVEILKENIFGVDLDPKAVEIAQLNLLLKTAEKKHRLPTLQENIKVGNSLIDNSSVAGDKAFKWEDEFKDVMKNGGFDVIMGNPPWGADISQYIDYFVSKYRISKKNLNSFDLFVRNAISLLKDKGFLGFVIPKNSIKSNDYTHLRKYILENTLIKKLTLFGIFEGVTQEFIVLILVKNHDKLETKSKNKITLNDKEIITQDKFYNNTNFIFNPELKGLEGIFKKVEIGEKLGDKIFIKRGEEISKKGEIMLCYSCNNWFPASKQDKKNCPICKKNLILSKCKGYELVLKEKDSNHTLPIITGEDITPFNIMINHYFDNTKKGISYKSKETYSGERLLMNKIASTFKAGFMNKEGYCTQNVYVIKFIDGDGNKLKALLAFLNSRLWKFYYEKKFNLGAKITTAISLENVRNLHFPNMDSKFTEKIVNLVNKILSLSKRLNEIKDKQTDEKVRFEKEIQKLDDEIDEGVYNLYGITAEEKKIIEDSLK